MTLPLIIGGCLLFSFLLSGLESAILSLSPARLRHLAKAGRRRAAFLERMLKKKDQLLASILVLNATVNLLAFALITDRTADWLGNWGYVLAFVVSLPVYLIWVETLPKSVFKKAPIRLLIFFVPLLGALFYTIRPLILLLAMPGQWLGARFSGGSSAPPGSTREEFRALTEILARDGSLDPEETRMIRGVLDFQQVRVGEVMLPLSAVTAVPQEMPIETVVSLGRQTEFDQFPIMAQNGDLVGLVDVLELLRDRVSAGTVHQYRHKLVRSDPSERAVSVIRRLRRAGHQIAAVYHPSGRPIGIVSVEDMVRRLTLGPAGA